MEELKGLPGVSCWLVYNKIVFNLVFIRRFNFIANDQTRIIRKLPECKTLEDFQAVTKELSGDRYKRVHSTMAEILDTFKASSVDVKKAMLLEAISFTELSDDESIRLLSVHRDSKGIKYSKSNVGNLVIKDIMPLMLDSLVACSELDIDFALMNKDELDAVENGRVDISNEVNAILTTAPDLPTATVISTALKNILARLSLLKG